MENGQQFCFSEGDAVALGTTTTTSCRRPRNLKWTHPSYQTEETAWSVSPFNYPPIVSNSHPCLCLRYRNMDVSTNKTNSNLDSEPKQQQHKSLSISKNLKFGIERILNENYKEERSEKSSDKVEECSEENLEKPSSSAKNRRKNGTRSVFSHVQRNILELHYQQREYVTKGERYHIAMATGISEEQVKIWFQNRRTKKKKIERNKVTSSSKTDHCSLNIMNFQ